MAYDIDEKSGRVTVIPDLTPYQLKQIEINKLEDLYPNGEHKFTTETYLAFVKQTLDAMQVKIKAKNADYTNGAGPFANFEQASDFGVDPFQGLMLRMGDKMQRVKSYCKQGKLEVANEGIEDCFYDFIGYSLIALAMLKEKSK